MEKLFTAAEIADLSGLTDKRVRQLADELIANGHGQRVGKTLVLRKTAATYIRNRPDNRGRPKRK